jgi:hypothetical protein
MRLLLLAAAVESTTVAPPLPTSKSDAATAGDVTEGDTTAGRSLLKTVVGAASTATIQMFGTQKSGASQLLQMVMSRVGGHHSRQKLAENSGRCCKHSDHTDVWDPKKRRCAAPPDGDVTCWWSTCACRAAAYVITLRNACRITQEQTLSLMHTTPPPPAPDSWVNASAPDTLLAKPTMRSSVYSCLLFVCCRALTRTSCTHRTPSVPHQLSAAAWCRTPCPCCHTLDTSHQPDKQIQRDTGDQHQPQKWAERGPGPAPGGSATVRQPATDTLAQGEQSKLLCAGGCCAGSASTAQRFYVCPAALHTYCCAHTCLLFLQHVLLHQGVQLIPQLVVLKVATSKTTATRPTTRRNTSHIWASCCHRCRWCCCYSCYWCCCCCCCKRCRSSLLLLGSAGYSA